MEKRELTANLHVTGMTCAACSSAIGSALKDSPGVLKADVSLGREVASVVFDPKLTSV
ncbi:MAG: heavy-metal-associated domain-containing protein, partial [Thermoplasmatota archaeon]